MPDQKTIIKKTSGYCVVQNEVSQALRKHTGELGLYIFLLSLPDGWEFRKSWLKEETGLGIHKLNKFIKFLKNHNLVKTRQLKEKGKFANFEMEILDGKDFEIKDLTPLFGSPRYKNRNTVDVLTRINDKKVNTDTNTILKQRELKDDKDMKPVTKRRSPSLTTSSYPDDFFPDEERRELLDKHASSTNNTQKELLDKFESVSRRYKTRSVDWQHTFAAFLERELPKKIYEDSRGQRKRMHDDQSINY